MMAGTPPKWRTGRRVSSTAATLRDRLSASFGPRAVEGERGGATVEFAILLPVFLGLFLAAFESAMILTRQAMFERAVTLAGREVRLGTSAAGQETLGAIICQRARLLPECEANLSLDLHWIDPGDWALPADRLPCVGAAESTGTLSASPIQGGLMLLRACLRFDPILPGIAFGGRVASDEEGALHMVAATAFAVESPVDG